MSDLALRSKAHWGYDASFLAACRVELSLRPTDVERTPDSVLLPSQALFLKGGRTVVYVRRAWGFDERAVEVAHRTPKQVAVARGLKPGEHVALRDPTLKEEAQ